MDGLNYFMKAVHEAAEAGHNIATIDAQHTSEGTFLYAIDTSGNVVAAASVTGPEDATLDELQEAGELCAAIAEAGGKVMAEFN